MGDKEKTWEQALMIMVDNKTGKVMQEKEVLAMFRGAKVDETMLQDPQFITAIEKILQLLDTPGATQDQQESVKSKLKKANPALYWWVEVYSKRKTIVTYYENKRVGSELAKLEYNLPEFWKFRPADRAVVDKFTGEVVPGAKTPWIGKGVREKRIAQANVQKFGDADVRS